MDGSSKTLMNACQLRIRRKSLFLFTFIPTVNIAIGRRSFIQRVRVCVSLIVRERERRKEKEKESVSVCACVRVLCVLVCMCVWVYVCANMQDREGGAKKRQSFPRMLLNSRKNRLK